MTPEQKQQTVSHDTQVKQEDKELAKQYLKRWGAENCITMYEGLDALVDTFASALATVRREEREAAFKILCPDCAEGDTPTYDSRARWHYHRWGSDEVMGCSASKLRMAVEGREENSREHIS